MIRINNVNKYFGDNHVLRNLDVKINVGESVAIVGKSGSGKSTLLNIIGLLDNDFEGKVYLNGKDTKVLKKSQTRQFVRENINYLFQNYALIDDETVYSNLEMAQKYKKMNKEEKSKEIEEILKLVGLNGFQDKLVYTLSGGEQQRVSLARSLIKPGSILIADEPTGNLDEENAKIILEILQEHKNKGNTVVIATHDMKLASSCERIIHIS